MISFLVASLLVSTPDQAILDEARLLGRDMAMGQICEVIQVATFDGDAVMQSAEALISRSQTAGVSEQAINDAAEQAHNQLMADLETQHPSGDEDAAIAHLTKSCNELITSRPAYFSTFKAD